MSKQLEELQMRHRKNKESTNFYFEYKGELYYSDYLEDLELDEESDVEDEQYTRKVKVGDGWEDAVTYYPVKVYVNSKDDGDIHYRRSWNTSYIRSRSDFESKFTPRPDIKD
jgi:hypothetical protein